MMLAFNFSGINTQTLDNANDGFTNEVRSKINVFIGRYNQYFLQEEEQQILEKVTPNDLLNALFHSLQKKELSQYVYVIIDEYDHFANNILSQGKEMFKELVKTDGYVRPFYEALKKGTEGVVDRIFITGVLPILLDSLTSGFNIGMNLSTDVRFNEIFGFTEAEIAPILDALGENVDRNLVRTYYNGYRFSPRTKQSVYNSDMVLFYGLKYDPVEDYIESMLDPNVISDYRKIRAVLSIGERDMEESILTRIVEQQEIRVSEITPIFMLTQETEFLFDEDALISLLFYMGYLTIAGRRGISIVLTMPNLVLKSLYWEYMQHTLMRRGAVRVGSREKQEMLQDLVDGKIEKFIGLTEKMLNALSNRDYERFDEKYIKAVMLSLLSDVNIYIPRSEYEIGADGYVDLYLQAAFEPQQSAHYFIELKYAKARTTKTALDAQEQAGRNAMQTYLSSPPAQNIKNLQAYVLVFKKDSCVRKVACFSQE